MDVDELYSEKNLGMSKSIKKTCLSKYFIKWCPRRDSNPWPLP